MYYLHKYRVVGWYNGAESRILAVPRLITKTADIESRISGFEFVTAVAYVYTDE